MDGLSFIAPSPAPVDPARMDVALFVGFVARRAVAPRAPGEPDDALLARLPAGLRAWLAAHDWRPGRAGRTAEALVDLLDVPVPVDAPDAFDALFATGTRPVGATGGTADAPLGAAVRRFFALGGRRAYVVRLGDPPPVGTPAPERAAAYLSAFPAPAAVDPSTWRGLGHLFGLPDVSLVALPDLPDLFAAPPAAPAPFTPDGPPEAFVACAARGRPPEAASLRRLGGPGLDAAGFAAWGAFARRAGAFVERAAPGVQLVLAVPRPASGHGARTERAARDAQWAAAAAVHTRAVQLAYPWLRTDASARLPGDLEPPDGALVGLLAAHALRRGAWQPALGLSVPGVRVLDPVPDRALLDRPLPPPARFGSALRLRDRVTVFGMTPSGVRLRSDVTTAGGAAEAPAQDEAYRPASVHRLLAAVLRAARRLGEAVVFEPNGEPLWRRLREGLEAYLAALHAEGVLGGAEAADAFTVRCDRATMTQNDLDGGRAVVRVAFTAARPVVHLAVAFAVDDGGRVALHAAEPAPA